MNIFILDKDPELCARYHCDKHVLKQIPDIAKILCTVMRESGIPYGYTSSNKNHPCVKWAQTADGNFMWLRELGLELCREYSYRYGKSGGSKHASEHIILDSYPKNLGDKNHRAKVREPVGMTPPVQCVPAHFKCNDPVKAYRDYYLTEKADILAYTKRNVPGWVVEMGMGEHK
jgi:hypothetical protein